MVLRRIGRPVRQEGDLLCQFGCRSLLQQTLPIRLVHPDDVVEVEEVFVADGTGATGQIVASASGMSTHTPVGQFAFVVPDDTSRVDLEGFVLTRLGDEVTEDPFSRRASTDIAKADEEDPHGSPTDGLEDGSLAHRGLLVDG